jgi:cell division protein ZapA
MTDTKGPSDLASLKAKLAELVNVVNRLAEENRMLKASQEQLSAEKANLLAKNEMARRSDDCAAENFGAGPMSKQANVPAGEAGKQLREPLTLKIAEREYAIMCEPAQRKSLSAAAKLVDERMRDAREKGGALGTEKAAVLTALHIATELLQLKADVRESDDVLENLHAQLDAAMRSVQTADA